MKVFISVDIEGATGVVAWAQCEGPTGEAYDWPFARRMLTQDVNAAIRGARAAGATEVVVKDSHASCRNLLIDELEPGTRLISGFGGTPNYMMQGIDGSFDAAFLIGYHAKAGTLDGVLEHALVGGLHRCWINGKEAGEIAASAAIAGAFGVPLTLVTSDALGCKEAEETVFGIKTYVTKTGLGRFIADLKHPSETGPGIEAAAREAVAGAGAIQPYGVEGPVTWRVQFREMAEAEMAAVMPGVHRVGGYTIEFGAEDFLSSHRMAFAAFQLSARGRNLGG